MFRLSMERLTEPSAPAAAPPGLAGLLLARVIVRGTHISYTALVLACVCSCLCCLVLFVHVAQIVGFCNGDMLCCLRTSECVEAYATGPGVSLTVHFYLKWFISFVESFNSYILAIQKCIANNKKQKIKRLFTLNYKCFSREV